MSTCKPATVGILVTFNGAKSEVTRRDGTPACVSKSWNIHSPCHRAWQSLDQNAPGPAVEMMHVPNVKVMG